MRRRRHSQRASEPPEVKAPTPLAAAPPVRAPRWLLPVFALLFAGLPLLDVLVFGFPRLFRYLAADSFYYLTVAANFPDRWTFTFDQIRPTNGFHPVWQVALSLCFVVARLIPGDPREAMIVVAWVLSWASASVGLLLVVRALKNELGNHTILLLLLPTGLTAIVACWAHLRYLTTWNSINGMESGFALCAFGVVACLLGRSSLRSALGLGIALGTLVLSRLDTVFVLPAAGLLGLFACFDARRAGSPLRAPLARLAACITVASLMVAAYMLASKHLAGSYLPVSGAMKSTFPHPDWSKFRQLARMLWGDALPEDVNLAWRYALLFVPLVAASLWLAVHGWRTAARLRAGVPLVGTRFESLMFVGSGLVVGLHTYNLLFVREWEAGHWYYAVSQVVATLAMIDALRRIRTVRHGLGASPGRISAALVAIQATYFILVFALPVPLQKQFLWDGEEDRARYHSAFADRERVRAFYGGMPPPILEVDDGIVAYTLGSPSMSGLGPMLDREAIASMQRGDLLTLAHARGFDRLASCNYFARFPVLYRQSNPATIDAFMRRQDFYRDAGRFRWTREYIAADDAFVILRFEPLASNSSPRSASASSSPRTDPSTSTARRAMDAASQ